ncbi:MAG: serine/threonine-protein kinase [Planctomycetota bacterium]
MNESLRDSLVAEFVERRDRGEDLTVDGFLAESGSDDWELRHALMGVLAVDAALPPPNAALPERIGRWRVLGTLGSGGVGRVLRVRCDGDTEPERALKLLAPIAAGNPRARERLLREGATLRSLAHPGIVRCHEVGFSGDVPHLVMDLVRGQPLSALVQAARGSAGGPPACARLELPGDRAPGQRVAAFVAGIARAVSYLHDAGLLHRDLKPSNVLLEEESRRCVLVDFGLAGGGEFETLTRTGDVLGTPVYMAPEQARGEPADPRTDVFGLGVILFELLTLEPPRTGRDALAVLEMAKTQPVRPPQRVDPSLPPALVSVCRRALAFDRRWRFRTARELADALAAFAAGRSRRVAVPLRQRIAEGVREHRVAVRVALLIAVVGPLGWWATRESHAREPSTRALAVALDALVEHGDDFEERAEEFIAHDPQHPTARALRRLLRGQTGEADGSSHAAALFEGIRRYRERDYPAAREAMLAVAERHPDDATAALMIGRIASMTKDLELALRELQTSIRLLPTSRSAHRTLGVVFRWLGRLDEAERVIQQGVALDDSWGHAWYSLGRVYLEQDRLEEALVAVDRAIALDSPPGPRRWRNARAVILDRLGRYEDAASIYMELIEDDPKYVTALHNLGRALHARCRLGEAMRCYERAVATQADYLDSRIALAELHAGMEIAAGTPCGDEYAQSPELLQPDKAERLVLEGVRLILSEPRDSDADTWGIIERAVATVNHLSRQDRLRELLHEMRVQPGTSDRRFRRITNALDLLQ